MQERMSRRERVEQLEAQLAAQSAQLHEIGVLGAARMMTRRVWSREEVLDAHQWLMGRNYRGDHIFMRPAGTEYVLVDDVNVGTIAQMGRDGLEAASVVETSPANYQVWFRFPEQLGRVAGTAVAQVLARRYDADLASAAVRHLGRAAGFMNRKPKYMDGDGEFPWVRHSVGTGEVVGKWEELLEDARVFVAEKEARREVLERQVANARRVGSRGTRKAAARLGRELAACRHMFGVQIDESRAEAAAAARMAKVGFSREEVMAALLSLKSVRVRKAGHVADYCERTVRYAFGDQSEASPVRAKEARA